MASVLQTDDGGFIFAGESFSDPGGNKTSPNFGGSDVWLVRVDKQGRKLWDKSYGADGGITIDRPMALLPAKEGGFILGGRSDVGAAHGTWIFRLNDAGTVVWSNYTFLADSAGILRQTSDRGFMLGGAIGEGGCFIAKLNTNGAVLWQRGYGGALLNMEELGDGGFILVGLQADPFGANDAWVARVDKEGNMLWEHTYGTEGWDGAFAILPQKDGGSILGGSSYPPPVDPEDGPKLPDADIWLVRLDGNGLKLGETRYTGHFYSGFSSLQETKDGGLVLGGSIYPLEGETNQSTFGESDMWVLRLDEHHRGLWYHSFGGTKYDFFPAAIPTADGGVMVAGSSYSGVGGNKTTSSFGAYDYWAIKLAKEPACDSDRDGVPDYLDACPDTRRGNPVDRNGCSIDQLVPCDGPWRHHGEYIYAVMKAANKFKKAGLITKKQRLQIVLRAITSRCGGR